MQSLISLQDLQMANNPFFFNFTDIKKRKRRHDMHEQAQTEDGVTSVTLLQTSFLEWGGSVLSHS